MINTLYTVYPIVDLTDAKINDQINFWNLRKNENYYFSISGDSALCQNNKACLTQVKS